LKILYSVKKSSYSKILRCPKDVCFDVLNVQKIFVSEERMHNVKTNFMSPKWNWNRTKPSGNSNSNYWCFSNALSHAVTYLLFSPNTEMTQKASLKTVRLAK